MTADHALPPIRIAHFSDTHLGYRGLNKVDPESGRNQRTIDVDAAFERTVTDILARKVDLVIHSGDVFHHTRPTWHSMRHFIRQMRRIEQAGIPTVVIAGNHDTPRLRTGGSAYSVLDLALPEIRFVAEYDDQHITDGPFEAMNLHIQAIPHGALTNPDPVGPLVVPGKRNILVCHGMVPGILRPGQHTEAGEQELNTALLDSRFDYIALGHYHVPMQPAPKAWYGGSTERFGFGDWDVTPGYTLVTMHDPGQDVEVEHIDLPARPMVTLKPVYGSGGLRARDIADKVITQLGVASTPDAMVRVELRETERPVRREVESILKRESEPFAWSLTVSQERNLFTPEAAGPTADIDGVPDIRTLFRTFVADRTGTQYDPGFAQQFLERGDQALVDAILAQETPDPEEAGTA
ncbi:MAG: DNA repair exonuclease [Thermomicrobiales bacterium]